MRLSQLRALVALADNGSIRGAARALGLSQAALTRSLRDLEKTTDAKLLLRRTHGTEFTPAGRSLVSHGRLVLATMGRAEEEVKRLSGHAQTSVRIAATPVLVQGFIDQTIEAFLERYPAGSVDVDIGLLSTSLPRLLEGLLDVSFGFADPAALPAEIAFDEYARVQLLPIVKGAAADRRLDWQALTEMRWIINPAMGATDKMYLDWMAQRGLHLKLSPIRIRSAYMLSVLPQHFDCVLICPEPIYHHTLRHQGFRLADVQDMPPPMPLGALTLRSMPQSEAIQFITQRMKRLCASL